MKNLRRAVSYTRQATIMEKATELRNDYSTDQEPCDLISVLEFGLRKMHPSFDWIVGEPCDFNKIPDAEAYVDFSQGKNLVIRADVYDRLFSDEGYKTLQARFILAHEIGHIVLHSRSTKALPRRKLGSSEQYLHNPKLEREANIFAGSLLVPTTNPPSVMDANTIAIRFSVSNPVAAKCVQETSDYRRLQLMKGNSNG